ncbi:thioesterase family protein [Stutzerimonas chloritidismutans]|uniref:thioesterase family protein n=1 Tax=Stutzerimonas chloritidismutans TaxID=203192 RepID=UPI003F136B31
MTSSDAESQDAQHQAVRQLFERIPFNEYLGIELDEVTRERVVMHLPMKHELIGNFFHGILHGGVIASLLDVVGGAMAMIGAFEKHQHLSREERALRLSRLGTIDLRVDYLRPGRGERFSANATLLRSGNKVAVVRSELVNEHGVLIAVGTGTYLCG